MAAAEVSAPGQITILHPDELHDGHAGTEEGFGYRMLYVEPALIFAAVQAISGRASSLPFVRTPVVVNPKLAAAITSAFQSTREPLAIDSLVDQLAEGLVEADPVATKLRLSGVSIWRLWSARASSSTRKRPVSFAQRSWKP